MTINLKTLPKFDTIVSYENKAGKTFTALELYITEKKAKIRLEYLLVFERNKLYVSKVIGR